MVTVRDVTHHASVRADVEFPALEGRSERGVELAGVPQPHHSFDQLNEVLPANSRRRFLQVIADAARLHAFPRKDDWTRWP